MALKKPNEWPGPAFLEPFSGRWVAVIGQEVLVHGESRQQVKAKLKHLRRTAEAVFLVRTYSKWGN